MGVTTGFFCASFEELAAAAPGWVTPRYGAFSEKEVLNPFTKKKTLVNRFELLSEPPRACPPDEIEKLIKPGRAYAWKLVGGELERLMRLMTDAPDEKIAELERPALIGPADAEHWVFEVPEPFVAALANLSKARLPEVGRVWQDKVGWSMPPTTGLEELAEVAAEAVASQRRMFSYVSL